jgi:predicted acyltransferase
MGMAIPYAIQNRIKRGDTAWGICKHVFWRTVALLIMGVYTVNRDALDPVATGMSNPVFSLLMVIGFFLVWNVYPGAADWKRYLFTGMKIAGIILLVYLFSVFKGTDGTAFSPRWWGILGLIGWTYVICATIFLATRQNIAYNIGAFLVLTGCSILSAAGIYKGWTFINYVPSQATLHAFGMAGVCAALVMQKYADRLNPTRFFILMGATGVGMLIAAIISHQYWIISKLQATPAWLFYCCAIFFPFFALVYWLTDVKQKSRWFNPIKPAGTVTLTCYIIPYAWYSVRSLGGVSYPDWMEEGIPGLVKSAIFSLLVVGLAWILMKMKIRLKI